MANLQDVENGAQALKDYVASIDGWEAGFVPWGTYEQGARIVFHCWDSAPVPIDVATAQAACGAALYQAITLAGYDNVTPAACTTAAIAVLKATGRA
jgi:hypothetical protein